MRALPTDVANCRRRASSTSRYRPFKQVSATWISNALIVGHAIAVIVKSAFPRKSSVKPESFPPALGRLNLTDRTPEATGGSHSSEPAASRACQGPKSAPGLSTRCQDCRTGRSLRTPKSARRSTSYRS